jgi:uncharacterized repeat protein (TIGR03803 family)
VNFAPEVLEMTKNRINWERMARAAFLLFLTTAIASPAQTFTKLHSFALADGTYPLAGLIQAADGNLYGTTYEGGDNGLGTVFRITLSGKLTNLYSFAGTDGAKPSTRLVQATDRNLYGTTNSGGANGKGTVFKITPSGELTMLHTRLVATYASWEGVIAQSPHEN